MDTMSDISDHPCYYCGETFDGYGVDAVDIKAGFVEGNVQACCTFCNRSKADHHWHDFVRIMCNIGATHTDDSDWNFQYQFVNEAKDVDSVGLAQYKNRARSKDLRFEISDGDFYALVSQSCHYCGFDDRLVGLDRVEPSGHYTMDNVVPSCGACNFIKRGSDKARFVEKAIAIFSNWKAKLAATETLKST
jgi:hypothetical protein